MPDFKVGDFYTQKDDLSSYTKLPDVKKITKGEYRGQTYCVYTKVVHHDDSLWQLKRGICAFAATLFSLGLALLIPTVREWWKQSSSGDEVTRIKYINTPDAKGTTAAINQASKPILRRTPKTKPATRISLPLLEKIDLKEKPVFTSILGLTPKDSPSPEIPPLTKCAQIFTKVHDKYDNRMEVVMKEPLYRWHTYDTSGIRNITGLDAEYHAALDQRILDRFNLLNDSFELKKRLASSEYNEEVQIQDIDLPWNESGLKIMLFIIF